MKTIGLIGGTSWISTVEYYSNINRLINKRLGGHNSAKILLFSLNFEEFISSANPNNLGQMAENLSKIAKGLENGGADCIILCANTPHIAADIIQQNISIPLINIAEVTAKEILKQKINMVGLLGTNSQWNSLSLKTSLLRME